MMLISCVFSALFSVGGLALGWSFDLPVGAMVVILAGIVFLAAGAVKVIVNKA
jgi:zinc transport system permease protein